MKYSTTETRSPRQTYERDLAEDELHVLAEVELDEVAGGMTMMGGGLGMGGMNPF